MIKVYLIIYFIGYTGVDSIISQQFDNMEECQNISELFDNEATNYPYYLWSECEERKVN